MRLTRRHFVGSCVAAGAALPATACHAAAAAGQFRPESYGAVGDGRHDDYAAFERMVSAVNAARGGVVVLSPRRTYFFDRYTSASNGATGFSFKGCDGLTIEGNGAAIRVKGDFHRRDKSTRGLPGLRIEDCRRVTIRNLELVGNVDRMTRERSLNEAPTHGLLFGGCMNVLVEGVTARHFAGDGMYIRDGSPAGPNGVRPASRAFTVRNSRFLYNARQGLSVIQLRGGTFENCDFSYTGFIDAQSNKGRYGFHAPGAGVDVEPNRTPGSPLPVDVRTGELIFRNCRMIGNHGAAFLASKYSRRDQAHTIEGVTLESSMLECAQETPSRYGLIFDVPQGVMNGCTLQMHDRTAFVGWSPQSTAQIRFTRNVVRGRNPAGGRPFFALRRTQGTLLIEGNQFIGEHRQPKPVGGSWLLLLDNPGAMIRDNSFFLPAQAFPAATDAGMAPAVLADVKLMDSNRHESDLPANNGRYFGVLYGRATAVRNEAFRGTLRGPEDSVRPAELDTRRPIPHDSRLPLTR